MFCTVVYPSKKSTTNIFKQVICFFALCPCNHVLQQLIRYIALSSDWSCVRIEVLKKFDSVRPSKTSTVSFPQKWPRLSFRHETNVKMCRYLSFGDPTNHLFPSGHQCPHHDWVGHNTEEKRVTFLHRSIIITLKRGLFTTLKVELDILWAWIELWHLESWNWNLQSGHKAFSKY